MKRPSFELSEPPFITNQHPPPPHMIQYAFFRRLELVGGTGPCGNRQLMSLRVGTKQDISDESLESASLVYCLPDR
jgi:hypothetical protein